MQARHARARKQLLTLGQLRDQLALLMLADAEPVMVTKDGIPLGFFLPAKVWKTQPDSALSRHLVELVLSGSGHTREELQPCINAAASRRHPPLKMAALGA